MKLMGTVKINNKNLSNLYIIDAVNLANTKLFLLANIFGKISPKIKIINEINTTSIIRLNRELSIFVKNSWLIFENKRTKAIFIKLFATSIVANSLLGFLSSFSINPFSLM
jgi:hypothetical protein